MVSISHNASLRFRPLFKVGVIALSAFLSGVFASSANAVPPVTQPSDLVASATGTVNYTIDPNGTGTSAGWTQRTEKRVDEINFLDPFSGPPTVSSTVPNTTTGKEQSQSGNFVVTFECSASGSQLPPTLYYKQVAKAFARISTMDQEADATTRVRLATDFSTVTPLDVVATAKAPASTGDPYYNTDEKPSFSDFTVTSTDQAENGKYNFKIYSSIQTHAKTP